MKRYDLMNQVNARGTWMVSKLALPYLKKSKNPHILNLSPPLTFEPRWVTWKYNVLSAITTFTVHYSLNLMSHTRWQNLV